MAIWNTFSTVGCTIGAGTMTTLRFWARGVSSIIEPRKLLDLRDSWPSDRSWSSMSVPKSTVSGVRLPAVLVTENPVRLQQFYSFYKRFHHTDKLPHSWPFEIWNLVKSVGPHYCPQCYYCGTQLNNVAHGIYHSKHLESGFNKSWPSRCYDTTL